MSQGIQDERSGSDIAPLSDGHRVIVGLWLVSWTATVIWVWWPTRGKGGGWFDSGDVLMIAMLGWVLGAVALGVAVLIARFYVATYWARTAVLLLLPSVVFAWLLILAL